MEDLQIVGIALMEGGDVEIGYARIPTDLKKNGLVWTHSVRVPRGSDYDDELEALDEAIKALLLDVLDDEDRVDVIEIEDDETETEEED